MRDTVVGGQLTPATIISDLPILDGQVTVEASTRTSPRRSLSLEVQLSAQAWTELSTPGTYLQVYRGVQFVDGSVERVLLGTFDVDEASVGYGPDNTLSISAPDVWARVSKARFEAPRTVAAGTAVLPLAVTWAAEAVGKGYPGFVAIYTGDRTSTIKRSTFARDRAEAVSMLAARVGAWVYATPAGLVTARDIPSLSVTPVWTVDASASGVLLDASRTRSTARTYNVVVVSSGDTDGKPPFNPVTVADTDPTSPTYVDGPMGRVPYFVASSLLDNATQAAAYGTKILRRVRGLAAQLQLTTIVNPALEPGDVISVMLPGRGGQPPKTERHVVDAVSIPLSAAGTQNLSTRSTRPEGDVVEEV